MKRIAVVTGVLLVIAVALLATLPLLISSDTVRNRILTEAHNLTGRTMTFRGNPNVSFRPFLGIEISDVVMADPLSPENSPPLIQMEKLLGKLNIIPAIFGEAELRSFQFVRPQFNFRINASGQANWVFERGQLREVVDTVSGTKNGYIETTDAEAEIAAVALGRVEIVDGVANYVDTISGTSETITNLNGVMDWPRTDNPARIEMRGIWQGEQIKVLMDADKPVQLMGAGSSRVDINLISAPVSAGFHGDVNLIADFHLAGDFEMHSPSVNRLAEFFGVSLMNGMVFGALSSSGKLDATPSRAQLTEAAISIGGSQSEGLLVLSLNEVENPKLDGTLAFDAIDTTPFLGSLLDTGKRQSGENGEQSELREFSVDLRISSQTMSAFDITSEDIAAALSVRGGKWSVDVGNAMLAGGNVIAKINADLDRKIPGYSIDIKGTDAQAEEVAALLGSKILKPAGKISFKLDVETNGTDLRTLVRNTDGSVRASIDEGTLGGVDLVLLETHLDQDKKRISIDDLEGTTSFERLDLKLAINRGIAWISDTGLVTGTHELSLTGNSDLQLGGLAVQAKLRKRMAADEQSGSNPEEQKPWRHLFIGGTYSAPLLTLWPFANRPDIPPVSREDILKEPPDTGPKEGLPAKTGG